MDERGEPYLKRPRIDSTDEALSLNSNLPDELSLINCGVSSGINSFTVGTHSYVNSLFNVPPTLSATMAENQSMWMGPRNVIPERILPVDPNSSVNMQMPKSQNKTNARLQSQSLSFSYGNGSANHQMNPNYSASPVMVDCPMGPKLGQKRPFSVTTQSTQPATHMLPLVPLSSVNPVRVMSLSSTNKDSGGMYSTFSVVSTKPSPSNAVGLLGDTIDMKKKLIQKQLVLLLHAHKCHRRELNGPVGKGGNTVKPCNLPQCSLMKDVLKHMSTCNEGKNCKTMHCSTSRQIISHWKNCSRPGCVICTPLRHCGDSNNNNNINHNNINSTNNNNNNSSANGINNFIQLGAASVCLFDGASNNVLPSARLDLGMLVNSSQTNVITINNSTISTIPKMGMKPWHAMVTEDLRNHLVKKLVQAIMPVNENINMLKHPHIKSIVNYAKKVEGDNFDKANSREEYYNLLAGKIYKIQKDLQMQRSKKMEQKFQAELTSRVLPSSKMAGLNQASYVRLNSGGTYSDLQDGNLLAHDDSLNIHPDLLGLSPAFKGSFVNKCEPMSPSLVQHHQNISGQQQQHQQQQQQQQQQQALLSDLGSVQYQATDSKQSERFKTDMLFSPLATDSGLMPDSLFEALSSTASIGSSGSPLDCLNQFLPMTTTSMKFEDLDVGISLSSLVGAEGSLDSIPPASSTSSAIIDACQGNSIGDLLTSGSVQQEAVTSSTCSPLFTPVTTTFVSPFEGIVTIKKEEEGVILKKELEAFNDADKNSSFSFQVKSEESKPEELKLIKEETVVKEEPWDPSMSKPKVFTKDELYQVFLPSLDKMYWQEPDAIPFREPVDSVKLAIPDYYNIIKNPMDLSTIRQKLESGQYSDPWQYIMDVHLMFENAWLYNKKSSKVYKFCTKLSEIFQAAIDAPMRSLGFCCGQKLVFTPQALCCYGKELCTIARESIYYYYDKYTYCEKCFNDILKPEVDIEDSSQSGLKIRKSEFIKDKNDKLEPELFVECLDCRRKLHKICILHFEPVHSQKFFCDACLNARNRRKKENRFNAKKLPNTKLGTYLESRVNQFLKKKDVSEAEVVIRVLSSLDKTAEVKSGMRQRFEGNIQGSFPYRVKTIFAFTEIEGSDVCFFGMHVQEYGSDCPEPNSRRVYIAYLDSVNFFKPRNYRTSVYHEILEGYLEYVKSLGFVTAHIWACPPSEGDDYIFHCHPPDQKIPKPKKLQEWYKKMLDKAVEDRVIVEYKDILQDAQENQLSCVTGMPYFEGDFWPTILEESIAEEKQKMLPKREEEDDEAEDVDGITFDKDDSFSSLHNLNDKKKPHKNNNGKKRSVKNKKNSKSRSKTSLQQAGYDDLMYKLFTTMEKYKEVFFVIYLQNDVLPFDRHSSNALPPIVDPDPVMNTDLMDGRDAFLTMCRERHLEFSSLRRAKYSSLAMLYELHIQMRESAVCCICQNCKVSVETRYHCTICEDFDLCSTCHANAQHPHRMIKIGLGLEDSGPSNSSPHSTSGLDGEKSGLASDFRSRDGIGINDATKRPQMTAMQRYEWALVHAASCKDANCRMGSCFKMKRLIAHLDKCRSKYRSGGAPCGICPQMKRLCLAHSRTCTEPNKCPVPACNGIRRKLEAKRNKERVQHEQLTRRRIINMKIEEADVGPASNSSRNGGAFNPVDENSSASGQYFSQKGTPAAKPCLQQTEMALPQQPREFSKSVADFGIYDSSNPSPLSSASPHLQQQHLSPAGQQNIQSPQRMGTSTSASAGNASQQRAHMQHLLGLLKSNPQNIPEIAKLCRSKPHIFATILKMVKERHILKGHSQSGVNGPSAAAAATATLPSSSEMQTSTDQRNHHQIPMQFQTNFQRASPQHQQQLATHQQQMQQQQQLQQQQPHQQQQMQGGIRLQQQQQSSQQVIVQSQMTMQQLQQQQVSVAQGMTVGPQHQPPMQMLQSKMQPQNQQRCIQQQQQQQHLQRQDQWLQQDRQMSGPMTFDPNLESYRQHRLLDVETNEGTNFFTEDSNFDRFGNDVGMWDPSGGQMKSVKPPYQQKQFQQQQQQFLQPKIAIYPTQQAVDNSDPMVKGRSRMAHPYQMGGVPFGASNPGVQTPMAFDGICKDASLVNNNISTFPQSQSIPYGMGQVVNNSDIPNIPQQQQQQQQQHIQQQQGMIRSTFMPRDPQYRGNAPPFPGHQAPRPSAPNAPSHRHPVPRQISGNPQYGYAQMDVIPSGNSGSNVQGQSYMQTTGQRFVRPGGQGQVGMHRPQFSQMGMNPMVQGEYSYMGNYSYPQQGNFQQVQQQQLVHTQQQQMVEPSLMCSPNSIPSAVGYSIQQSNQFQFGPNQLLESSDGTGHQMLPQQ